MPVQMPGALINNRVHALRHFHEACGIPRAELDLSGGIDSAVMACLLVMALGPENVTMAHTRINTDPKATLRAKNLARALKCRLAIGTYDKVLEHIVQEMIKSLVQAGYDIKTIRKRLKEDPTILGSIRSTLRAPLGRGYNRMTGGGIRHGTGNECEDRFLRFYQKGGDGEVDSNPIEMLSKTEVYQLAYALRERLGPKVREALKPIIEVAPSPDLWGVGEDKHTDEAELSNWSKAPFTYGRIDSTTGKITQIGTIERVARFLDCVVQYDTPDKEHRERTVESWLFGDAEPHPDLLLKAARESKCFNKFDDSMVMFLLGAARKMERATRHKSNTNIPTLGTRASLVEAGILSNILP